MVEPIEERVAGHYLIQKKIGEGAMGDIYLAFDERLDREVALKQFKIEGNSKEDVEQYKQKVLQEAKAIAKLNHPNIVSIYDFQNSDDKFIMVMEYVEGRNLQETLKHSKQLMSQDIILKMAIQLCEAMKQAHENGILHRNIKPANILISTHGDVKLTEFGIVRRTGPQDRKMKWGSFLYASPEQLNASEVDARSDVYSIGATLYEVMTGRPVYDAANVGILIKQILMSEPVPPHEINSELDEALSVIVLNCLDKQITSRYQSIEELLSDFYTLMPSPIEQSIPSPPESSQKDLLKDTSASQMRMSFLQTTTNASKNIFKYLQSDYNWLILYLQQCEKVKGEDTFQGIKEGLSQVDLQGDRFSGVLGFSDTFVFVSNGQICNAVNVKENLAHDEALKSLSDNAALQALFRLPQIMVTNLSNLISGTGEPLRENIDSAVVNLYPLIEDLSEERFTGFLICQTYVQEVPSEEPDVEGIFTALYYEGEMVFGFILNVKDNLKELSKDIESFINNKHCLLSLYTPSEKILDTAVRDLLSGATLHLNYKDPDEGTLSDTVMLSSGEMSHCLSEAVGQNIFYKLETHDGSPLPEKIAESITERDEYQCAHWLNSELFFSINAADQVSAFKALYAKIPEITRWKINQALPGEYGCEIEYSLLGFSQFSDVPLMVVKIGDNDPVEIKLFIEETESIQKALVQNNQPPLVGAVYISKQVLTNQVHAVFNQNTQKIGLFNKQKGWVKGKNGFHLLLLEKQLDQFPRLILPSLV